MKNQKSKKLNMAVSGLAMALALAATAASVSNVHAEASVTPIKNSEKVIEFRASNKDLTVTMSPLKRSYQVNEPIQFKIRGSKKFYLYVFSVDEVNNRAYMILPNGLQKGNRYDSRSAHIVPNRNVEFYSSTPGREKVIFVASTKYFAWDTSGYSEAGKFLATSAKSFRKQLKRIEFRSVPQNNTQPNRSQRSDVLVKETSVNIVGSYGGDKSRLENQVRNWVANNGSAGFDLRSNDGFRNASNSPMVFLVTNKSRYRPGDEVGILSGANQAGPVHFFVKSPGAAYKYLNTVYSDGRSMLNLTAHLPFKKGTHRLVAIYSKNKNPDALKSSLPSEKSISKGISFYGSDAKKSIAVAYLRYSAN